MTLVSPVSLVDRYVIREVAKAFAAIVVVLLAIVVSLMFLRTLEEVNLGGLGVDLVFLYLRLQLLRDASSLLPPAFFLAILVTLNRLARDSELIAMNACGIGPPRIYRTLILLAIPVALLTGWFALFLQPEAAAGIQEIRLRQKEQATQLAGLQPGRFYVEEQGGIVVYIGAIDQRQALGDIFILDRRGDESRLVISKGGQHRIDEATGDHLVTLNSGQRFDGQPGSGAFLVGDFAEYRIRIRESGAPPRKLSKRATTPSLELLNASDIADRVELEHRIAAPLAIFTLAVLAIPLVEISPRQKTSGRLLLAFLAYFSFFNLQRLAETWLESGVTPPWMGSLWYQFAILGAVYLTLASASLWAGRIRQRLPQRAHP